jgi:hypothetical protein
MWCIGAERAPLTATCELSVQRLVEADQRMNGISTSWDFICKSHNLSQTATIDCDSVCRDPACPRCVIWFSRETRCLSNSGKMGAPHHGRLDTEQSAKFGRESMFQF